MSGPLKLVVIHPILGPENVDTVILGPGVATRNGRQQKPRFLRPETKPKSEKSAAGDFFPIN
jgi:hypothetical protein